MESLRVRTEQPIAAKRRRGPGKPFTQSDPRINRGGVPSDLRAFHNWMRQAFARFLQEGAEDGLTNGEHIIRTLIQKAKDGDMNAIEYVLDRMGGKPMQSVEVAADFSFNFLSEADRIRAMESVERIKRMRAEGDAAKHAAGRTAALLPTVLEIDPVGGTPPGENLANRPSPKSEPPPKSVRNFEVSPSGFKFLKNRKQEKPRLCPHGVRNDHCVICAAIGY